MNILLDERIPRKLKRDLPGHNVISVAEARWAGVKDAPLLRLAETRFEVLITVDQNLRDTTLAVIFLVAKNNMLETLRPLIPEVLNVLQTIQPGEVVSVVARP